MRSRHSTATQVAPAAPAGPRAPAGSCAPPGGVTGRLLRLLVLALCYAVLELVGKAVVLLQIGFVLCRGTPSARLSSFARNFAAWMGALWAYVTFGVDEAPWPFRPWPGREPR